MDLRGVRDDYTLGALDEDASASVPVRQFETWLRQAMAAHVPEPTAMTLATVGDDGRPSTRVVLMKSVDDAGVTFYTNYRSRKARELAATPFAAASFLWPTLQRQVRIEGRVERVSEAESDEYFAQRPLDSRLGAWASPQSQVISSRAVLVKNAAEASLKHGLKPPRPDWWGGYRIVPDCWEFWQGRSSRLHDRLRYRLAAGSWTRERLAP